MSGDLKDGMTAIGNTEKKMIWVLALFKEWLFRPYLQLITLFTDISCFFWGGGAGGRGARSKWLINCDIVYNIPFILNFLFFISVRIVRNSPAFFAEKLYKSMKVGRRFSSFGQCSFTYYQNYKLSILIWFLNMWSECTELSWSVSWALT